MSCGRNSRLIETKNAKQPEKSNAKAVSWSSGRPSTTIAWKRLGLFVDISVGSAPSIERITRGRRPASPGT